MFKLIFIFSILFSSSSFAQMDFCTNELETFPVQAAGREKPLYVLATDAIKFMTGETKVGELSATEAFCKLSLKAFGMPLEIPIDIKVDHVEARSLLGMKENETRLPIQKMLTHESTIERKLAELKENNSLKKELNKIKSRINTYKAITQGQAWTVPVKTNDKVDFVTIGEYLTQERVMSAQDKGMNPVKYLFNEAKGDYLQIRGDHYLLELSYFKWNLFSWAMLLSICAILLLVALKNKIFGESVAVISIIVQIISITLRVMISGRAPITNMYETVMFSGLGALMISTIITLYRKEIAFMIAGLSFNVLTLLMMKFANGMLDEGISPLVPVLRDNFWLSTHVSTVILSYAALALSWVLANALLLKTRFATLSSAEYRYQVDLIYTCIKFGVVLLSAGIILGGVWADYSWGRFWGWDPKETWSLIVLLVYMAILHGKSTSWIRESRFVPLVAGAFMSVMMAWFGVNYILASGLHSYGFSEGGALFLATFFILQILIIATCTIKPIIRS